MSGRRMKKYWAQQASFHYSDPPKGFYFGKKTKKTSTTHTHDPSRRPVVENSLLSTPATVYQCH